MLALARARSFALFTLKKLECSKQGKDCASRRVFDLNLLNILAWDNRTRPFFDFIGFPFLIIR